MNEIYQQLLDRNARETTPFIPVYASNASLLKLTDSLQAKYDAAEREIRSLRQLLQEHSIIADNNKTGNGGLLKGPSDAALKKVLKNETKLRNKLEKLQEEYNMKLKAESDIQSEALKTATKLQEVQDLNLQNEKIIEELRSNIDDCKKRIINEEEKVKEAETRAILAEKQYDGLKTTIRTLQEENDKLRIENRVLEGRVVTDKAKLVDEMNKLNDIIDSLKKENEMLKSLNKQEEKRIHELEEKNNNKKNSTTTSTISSWFLPSSSSPPRKESNTDNTEADNSSRKFGTFGIVVPTKPKYTITSAHSMEGTCLHYESSGVNNLLATGSSDGLVKVWDTSTGTIRSTFRGTSGHAVTGCDIEGNLVIGGGSDKTCRIWNITTERLVHHLVGHQHRITCVRLYGGEKFAITGSADRSLKVWDISKRTYRQNTTLRHSSTPTCVDVASDNVTATSGHMDGVVRFWDIQSGQRTADISGIHEAGITSVCFDSSDTRRVLTNSLDSTLKIVDARTGKATSTLRHDGFTTTHGWAGCTFSPGGRYAAAGSSSNGHVFVWDTANGKLQAQLDGGHKAAAVAIDWCSGGSAGQQVATIDRKGVLVLWA